MKTEHLRVHPLHPEVEIIARAADVLRAGGLVAFPTETVYGLGAHALDAAAVERIFSAKQRPAHDPLIVHVADASALDGLVALVPAAARLLIERFWPGPLTLVMARTPAVPDAVTAGLAGVAVRAPNHPVAHALLAASGLPIAAPSANLFGHTSPTTADHVLADLNGRIDMVLDGGPTPIGVESTVLDVSRMEMGEPALLLRPGGVTLEALREVLGSDNIRVREPGAVTAEVALPSPGLLDRHYAPHTPLLLLVPQADEAHAGEATRNALITYALAALETGESPVLLAYDEDRVALAPLVESGCALVALGPIAHSEQVARRLYGALREADALQGTVLLARMLPGDGIAAAVRDRLRRAAIQLVYCVADPQLSGGERAFGSVD